MYIDTVSVVTESKLIDINGKDIIDYGSEISVDCCMNKIHFHGKKLTININEKQKRLVMCLFNDVNRKQDIIKVVWYENHKGISDNNYHQLIHKFRILLDEFGIPSGIIKTINRYGLRLDTSLLCSSMNSKCHDRFNGYHQSNN
ncbi:winged helix-turn-helix domain-containing protein [Candidatus Regiella insecticola]|uniref:Putative transcriptional regulator CadC n=1 Tax=Candidatus Regiella insecticola TaxID=138073 RepID=A0A6L2ZKX1_9ENTR|nr:helix-turn-helix domain-containing protein [Candidatus Regiella insecticola]GFN45199.1 putative transcriptional regulator CadC [Candidatus Regiella insecticola]